MTASRHDLAALSAAVASSPADALARAAYADALLDIGSEDEAAWQRDMARIAAGEVITAALACYEDMAVVDLADACRAAGVPGLDSLAEAAAAEYDCDDAIRILRGEAREGYLWLVYPQRRARFAGIGWHGDDVPPCAGEWVGDADQFGMEAPGAFVLTPSADAPSPLPPGWVALPATEDALDGDPDYADADLWPECWAADDSLGGLRDCTLHADGHGTTYALHCHGSNRWTLWLRY